MARWPYNTEQWRDTRPKVLRRDGFECQLRRNGCTGRATEVHHRVAPTDGGHPFDVMNLVSSCKSCNVAERNERRALWARIHNGEEPVEDVEVVRPW